MLREWNDDITNNALFIVCIAACEKVNMPWAGCSVDAARAQRGELTCIPEAKVGICWRLVQRKGHIVGISSAYFWYDSEFLKCKRSLFTRYHAPSTLLAFKFCEYYIDANSCDIKLSSHLSTFKLYFYSIKITLATGRLTNIDKLTFD